jgi:hypothetical protein
MLKSKSPEPVEEATIPGVKEPKREIPEKTPDEKLEYAEL